MEQQSQGMKVMVIDDSKTIRRTAETLLKKVGCEVITAVDGFDALAKIADQYKMPLEEVKKVLKDSMDRFAADVRSRRIQEFIVNNND